MWQQSKTKTNQKDLKKDILSHESLTLSFAYSRISEMADCKQVLTLYKLLNTENLPSGRTAQASWNAKHCLPLSRFTSIFCGYGLYYKRRLTTNINM